MFIPAGYAQERTATGSLKNAQSWSAISNQINLNNSRLTAIDTRIDQAAKCAAKGKTYGPGITGGDHEGCIAVTLDRSVLDRFIACGDAGMIYSQAANKCMSTIEKPIVCRMVTTTSTSNMSYGARCPAGYSHISTVFSHYQKPRYKDGCETCNPIYATTCGRMVCE